MSTTQKSLEFFFDVGSPTSYLAWARLPMVIGDSGAFVAWRPMLLGGVFKATGNSSPVAVPAKAKWMAADLQRWADRHGVAFHFNPHFPINTLALMRCITAVQLRQPDRLATLLAAVFRALWVDGVDLGDPALMASTLEAAGFDPRWLIDASGDADVKAALVATTEEAVSRGVFGAPTFFVDGDMYFGQDRLDFVAEKLRPVA